jgi:hypothetical protein
MSEIGAEVTFPQEQVDAADADITLRRRAALRPGRRAAGQRKEEEILRQRVVSLDDGMALWRARLGDSEPLPRDARAPSHAAAADLRPRRGGDAPARLGRRSTPGWSNCGPSATRLAAHDPIQLRADLEAAEATGRSPSRRC